MDHLQQLINTVQKEATARETGDSTAHLRLRDAALQLLVAVERPADTALRMRFMFLQQIALRTFNEDGVLRALCADGTSGITAKELSQKTNENELVITRFMRLLTAVGVVDELAENTYKPNALTEFMNMPGGVGGVNLHFDLQASIGAKLPEYVRTYGQIHQFSDEPGKPTPYEFAHDGKSAFEILKEDPAAKNDFDQLMIARRRGRISPEWFEICQVAPELAKSMGGRDEDVLLVDVGGGRGHDAEKFRQAYPDIPGKCILQDLPETIVEARKTPPKGVELMEYDFFTPQPIKGARMYFFRNIAHNWSDLRCQQILGNTVAAMDPNHSRILIEDFVLPPTGASLRAASMDAAMLCFAGMERTETQWKSLIQSVGLEIVKIWTETSGENEAVIEARKI